MKCIQCESTECGEYRCRFSAMPHDEFLRIRDAVNAYANASIQRDQAARYEGRPEHDMSCSGLPLKAGT